MSDSGRAPSEGVSDRRLAEAQERFILEWGRLGSHWGINRTMAQIHALLLVSARPYTVDEIIERLAISRGNASISLRELVDWGVVRRYRLPGDRKDFYESDGDMWFMFSQIIKERKRREVDPTYHAIRDCLSKLPDEGEGEHEVEEARSRLSQLVEIFELGNAVYDRVVGEAESLRQSAKQISGHLLDDQT